MGLVLCDQLQYCLIIRPDQWNIDKAGLVTGLDRVPAGGWLGWGGSRTAAGGEFRGILSLSLLPLLTPQHYLPLTSIIWQYNKAPVERKPYLDFFFHKKNCPDSAVVVVAYSYIAWEGLELNCFYSLQISPLCLSRDFNKLRTHQTASDINHLTEIPMVGILW